MYVYNIDKNSLVLCYKDVFLREMVDVVQEDEQEGVSLSCCRHSPGGAGHRGLFPEGVFGERHPGVYSDILHLNHSPVG